MPTGNVGKSERVEHLEAGQRQHEVTEAARRLRLLDVSDFPPDSDVLANYILTAGLGARIQSIERAANAAQELQRMLRQSVDVYHEHVILPLEEKDIGHQEASVQAWSGGASVIADLQMELPTDASRVVEELDDSAADGTRILQRGIQVSIAAMFGSVFIMLVSNVAGLAGLYIGFAVFCFANFAAYRVGERNVIVSPRIALMGMYGCLGLAATMVVAAFT